MFLIMILIESILILRPEHRIVNPLPRLFTVYCLLFTCSLLLTAHSFTHPPLTYPFTHR